mgnify:CR=1 FL=1
MKIKETKGITLIVLVITIVVLLILAGVAIATLNGNDNIIKNANTAVGKYNEKTNEEQGILNSLEEKLKEYTNGGSSNPTAPEEPDTPPTTPTVDGNGLATKNETIKPSADNPNNLQIVIPTGFAPAILQTGTTQSLPGEDGSVKEKMTASQWNNITAEDINKGIVVVDADGNEFVWIPITDTSKFARTAWTVGINKVTQTLADTSTKYAYWEDTNTSEYTNMVTSVTNNKGFYVARYEASADSSSTKAQSKRGAATWINISQTDAITAASKYNKTLNSHLMYGIEWDSILNWLNGNATISSSTSGETKTMELADIQDNSYSWGNYANSTGNAATNSGSLRNTGKSEYWKANNIYDLAGNVFEWTQEKWSTGTGRALRGGRYDYEGSDFPAAYRANNAESVTGGSIGFRASFYL